MFLIASTGSKFIIWIPSKTLMLLIIEKHCGYQRLHQEEICNNAIAQVGKRFAARCS